MKELPKYFVIKRDENNPLWEEYIDWLNETYGCDLVGDFSIYYGFDGNITHNGVYDGQTINDFQNSPTLITLEEWNECVNGFVLPEKWCIKNDRQEIRDWFANTYEVEDIKTWTQNYIGFDNAQYNNGVHGVGEVSHFYQNNTEITFEQFKTHVLKENNMEEEVKDMSYDKWKAGDLIECINTHFDCYIKGEIYEIKKIESSMNNDIYTVKDSVGSNTNAWNHSNFKFHSRSNKPMKNRTITAQQAQSIIDIACKDWKPVLAKHWAVTIVQKGNIEITEEYYKEMRSACTVDQHKLFDEIFGKDVKEFTSDDLKHGEWFKSWGGEYYLKAGNNTLIHYSGSVFNPETIKMKGKKVKIKSIQWEEVK